MYLALSILLLFPGTAYAYLDPVTGSVFIQVIIGLFMGALITVKKWWRYVAGLFSKKSSERTPPDEG